MKILKKEIGLLYRSDSKIHRLGLFSSKKFKKGDLIGEFGYTEAIRSKRQKL